MATAEPLPGISRLQDPHLRGRRPSARRRRLCIGLGLAILIVATLLSGAVALGRGRSGGDADAVGAQPQPAVEETTPSSAATTGPTTVAVPTAVATTVAPAAKPRPTTSTPARAPAKAPVHAPVHVDGVPQVKVTPAEAKVGDRVRLEGYGFTGEQWAAPKAPLWLALSGGCGLYAQAEHALQVTSGGRLSGEVTVPARGDCRQSDRTDEPVVAGRYRLAFTCTACFIGELKVVPSPATATSCRNVGFSPESDDVASAITASNMPCSEAEALVRKVGGPLGFNGAATAEGGGFRCRQAGREDGALPVAFYECTNGAKRVTFART